MKVVFYNGEFVLENDISISINSRSFNYGDGFFETVKILDSQPFNLSFHFDRIKLALKVLRLEQDYTELFLKQNISHLLKVNNIINGSIKIHVSRIGSGRYLPASNKSDLFIISSKGFPYQINNAISLCFYGQEYKASGSLSKLKSSNSLIYILPSIYASENNFDNAILLNKSGNIIEVTNANIFILKNNNIYTPPIVDGCVDGTMRRWVNNKLDVIEKSISRDEILDADEVFITNALEGVTSVQRIESIMFESFSVASSLQKKLINLNSDL